MEFVENFDEICRKRTRIFLLGFEIFTISLSRKLTNATFLDPTRWDLYKYAKKVTEND